LIDAVPDNDARLPVLKSAIDHLLDEDPRREGEYNYAAANRKVNHALGFYGSFACRASLGMIVSNTAHTMNNNNI